MSRTWNWVKLPLELLNNPAYGRLNDRLYRRATELRLMAGRFNAGGNLPLLPDMAWSLRLDAEDLEQDCILLEEVGILDRIGQVWRFASFEKDQAPKDPTAAERQERWRNKHQPAEEQAGPPLRNAVTSRVTSLVEVEEEVEEEKELARFGFQPQRAGDRKDGHKPRSDPKPSTGQIQGLEEHFCSLTHLPPMARQSKKSFAEHTELWRRPLSDLLSACNDDVTQTRKVMQQAIEGMRKDRLTISSPKSIVRVAVGLVAEQKGTPAGQSQEFLARLRAEEVS